MNDLPFGQADGTASRSAVAPGPVFWQNPHPRYHYGPRFRLLPQFRDRLIHSLMAYIRNEGPFANPGIELIALQSAGILKEAMASFLLNGPIESVFMRNNEKGLRPEPSWKPWGRLAKHLVKPPAIRYRPRAFLQKDVALTFSVSPLIRKHAEVSSNGVFVSSFQEWFSTGPCRNPHQVSGLNEKISVVLQFVREIADSLELPISDLAIESLRNRLERYHLIGSFYLNEIQKESHKIPRLFWSGTAGIMWGRIFAWVVRKEGGMTIGHDHGTGEGWNRNYDQIINESNFFTTFFNFTPVCAFSMQEKMKPELRFMPSGSCKLDSMPSYDSMKSGLSPDAGSPNREISLMLVSTIFSGTETLFYPLPPDDSMLSWHQDLFNWARKRKHAMFLKPHPESRYHHPESLLRNTSVQTVNQPISQALKAANVLIFDYPSTSAICDALKSDCGIVIVDLGMFPLTDHGRHLLEKRAVIVPTILDSGGVISVDWSLFEMAIEKSLTLRGNREFYDAYFGDL